MIVSCYCYHKGTYFQANHNGWLIWGIGGLVVIATTKVRIFKQITTDYLEDYRKKRCYCYHKGTYFQANHNVVSVTLLTPWVVIATTKVRIFKQITTVYDAASKSETLLLLPQRYVFSSKSQLMLASFLGANRCYCYHKGTYFQANHNALIWQSHLVMVVIATTKVRIFKQITTTSAALLKSIQLLLLPQRYVFSSKSQQGETPKPGPQVVIATTKVRIFKQITTKTSA